MSTPESPRPALPVGLTLDRGFALLRRHPRALLLPQLVLNVLPALVALVLVAIGALLLGDVETRTEQVRESTFLGDSTLVVRETADYTSGQQVVLGVLIAIGVVAFLWFLIAASVSVVRGADRAVEGRPHLPLGRALRESLAATPKLFGLGIVFGVLVALLFAAAGAVVALVAAAVGSLAVLIGLAAFAGLVYVVVRLLLWPVVHLSEDAGLGSFGRAWALTRGRFWALFGVLLLVGVVVSVVSFVASIGLQALLAGAFALDDTVGTVTAIPMVVFLLVLSVVTTAGYLAPVVVAYRTLAGRDGDGAWSGPGAPGSSTSAASAGPPPEPGVRRWAADEAPIDSSAPRSSGASDAPLWAGRRDDAPGGLPPRDAPSDPGMERWGRGEDDRG